MKQLFLSLLSLAFLSGLVSAQTITQSFGTGANAFSMDFVQIGNPNNSAAPYGRPISAGSVPYNYNLGAYEVSRDMIALANLMGGLGLNMYDMSSQGGNGGSKPATGINWFGAAKFVNWLNTSSGGTAAYKFDSSGNFQLWTIGDAGYTASNPFRNSLARFFLPSSAEWYKAAYGSPSGAWYNYPTAGDSPPIAVTGGTDPNTAVYNQSFRDGPANINNAGGLSAWGTMAQGGNVFEWTETAYDGLNDMANENRELRGGSWDSGTYIVSYKLDSMSVLSVNPFDGSDIYFDSYGFRVAMIPEPSSLSLLALGGIMVVLGKRRY
jgi:formylglycine-generating enzyme